MKHGFAIVVDIGKTLAKVSLWSRDGEMVARETRPNEVVEVDGIRRLDAKGIGEWLTSALSSFAGHPVEYIVPVAHGAGVAALSKNELAFPPIDYEQELPATIRTQYDAVRTPFVETGSPKLPAGLNFGAQLFWMEHLHPELISKSTLLPWAQYWGWFLSGEARTEATSMGCHSDLWAPASKDFSRLAMARGWAERFAPVVEARDVIGSLRSNLAEKTGLPETAKVLAGLHDSNAALNAARGFHEIENREATILSTGTWFIAMRLAESGINLAGLPEARDCLVNVDAFGNPVPSARFMGGREIETLIQIDTRQVDIKPDQPRLLKAVPRVIAESAMVLPTLAPGNGPYPQGQGGWVNRPDDWFARRAGACLYAALVADTSLDLIGSKECLLVEGRFAEAEVFVRALASLRPDTKVFVANAHNDVSFGALRLIDPSIRPLGGLTQIEPLGEDLTGYRAAWLKAQMAAA
ncbi:FGGY-family carbohydrate kinase [Altererythrobacter ishigakiensis]|uniref:Sugar (Pentulose or hexulose) kinase n=1 Tax=Altererythrobacter ishigakiensis TaxID=476157 RepID=A0A562UM03_9SPHN|nr:carbohydrate kinase [Altererythrobacter ishigakiensis]TWJ06661.1 sugar (pentulose or hexulose) kinase [Altererythrobacter ishigakiensis]